MELRKQCIRAPQIICLAWCRFYDRLDASGTIDGMEVMAEIFVKKPGITVGSFTMAYTTECSRPVEIIVTEVADHQKMLMIFQKK